MARYYLSDAQKKGYDKLSIDKQIALTPFNHWKKDENGKFYFDDLNNKQIEALEALGEVAEEVKEEKDDDFEVTFPSDSEVIDHLDGKGRVHQVKPEAGEKPVYTPATPNGNRKSKEEIQKERDLQKAISNPLVKNSLAKASFLEMDEEKQTEENKKNYVRDNLSDFCSSANFESKFVRVSYRDENNLSVNRDFYIVPNKFLEDSEKEIIDKEDKACQGCKICLPDGQQISFAEACNLAYNGIEKADEKVLGEEAEKEKSKTPKNANYSLKNISFDQMKEENIRPFAQHQLESALERAYIKGETAEIVIPNAENPTFGDELHIVELKDENGEVIKDENGKPTLGIETRTGEIISKDEAVDKIVAGGLALDARKEALEKAKDNKRKKEELKKGIKKAPKKVLTTAERAVMSAAKSAKNIAEKTAEKAVERTAEVGDFGR